MEFTTKECNTCNEVKEFIYFSKSTSGRHGYCNSCKECRSKSRKQLNFTPLTEGTKLCQDCKKQLDVSNFYRDKSNSTGLQTYCKECSVQHTKRWASTLEGYCKKIFADIQHNIKKRSKQLSISITSDDIKELYTKQEGLCALTGLKMTFDTYMIKQQQHIINKYNMSVDRIDSNKGYDKDNIQLVCAIINRMKTDLTDAEFIKLCGIIHQYNS
jgi:hypothetical protein